MLRILESFAIRLTKLEEATARSERTCAALRSSADAAFAAVSSRADAFEASLGTACDSVQARGCPTARARHSLLSPCGHARPSVPSVPPHHV